MRPQPVPRFQRWFATASLASSTIAAVVAALALVGWAFDLAPLKCILPSGADMNPAVAATSILASVALWLLRSGAEPGGRRLGSVCGILVAVVGGLVLGRYLFDWDTGIDTLLFRGKLGGNRMAPNTATFFILIGFALALLDLPGRRGHSPSQALALLALALCGLVLVGYSFGNRSFYGFSFHLPMAFNAVVTFTALAVGTLSAHPDRGVMAVLGNPGAGGMLVRRLMPAAIGIPWTLGGLRLAGEQAGLYDAQFGVSLMVVTTISLFLLLVWVASRQLERTDAERGRAEAALRQSSDEIRDLYDQAPCGYHSVDPDGKIIMMNQTEFRWLGFAATDVIGRVRFAEMVSPPSRETYRTTFARVMEQGSASDVELELVRRDGTTFPVLLNSSAVRDLDGRYLRSRTTLTDLTERKRAETATRLFANVVENIPLGLLIYQLDGTSDPLTLRIRSGNPGASQLLGIPLDESAGRAVVDVFPAIPEALIQRYAEVATSGRADDLGEFRYGDARVAERWWAVHAFPLPERSVGVAFQDVSDRKRAEAEIRRLNAELEDRVRERTAELTVANRDLAHKNAENEMFVYSVSHDLRSPLVNLQGFSKELEKGCQGIVALLDEMTVPPAVRDQGRSLLDGKMAKSIGFIQAAVMRLSGIIDALLRLSRAGRVEYRWEKVDVASLVGQVVAATQATIAERRAVVRVGDLPPAWGDRTAVEQVFGNLIGNALSYLDPARPGVIEVGCLPTTAGVGAEGFRTYYVQDNGMGIVEAHQKKIFQAFQRAHPGIGKGEGLGLAIVSRVVERHHGRVWVESKAGEGSTFYVTLPTLPEAAVMP